MQSIRDTHTAHNHIKHSNALGEFLLDRMPLRSGPTTIELKRCADG